MDLTLRRFVDEVGPVGAGAVTCVGGRTAWDVGGVAADGVREVRAPTGVVEHLPGELIVRVRAGTEVAELDGVLARAGQRVALPATAGATVGGVLAVGRSGVRRLGDGPVRDAVLEVRYVSADGTLVKGGGPVVKNVTGFDLCRLFVGALGTLGFIAEVVLRCRPRPPASVWLRAFDADPFAVLAAAHRPVSVLWDGASTWVLLEGHDADVAAERAVLAATGTGWTEVEGPPPSPLGGRRSVPAADVAAATRGLEPGTFLAEVGVGVVHTATPVQPVAIDAVVAALHRRVKDAFDPTGRLNPGRDVLAGAVG